MSGTRLVEEQEALIGLITWYRDEYHRQDFGHTEMIEEIKRATDLAQLEPHWRRTDDWYDML